MLGIVWCQAASLEFWSFIEGCHAPGRCQSDLSLLLLLHTWTRRASDSVAGPQGSRHPRLPESQQRCPWPSTLGLYFGGASQHWRRMHHCILMSLLSVFRAQLNPFFPVKQAWTVLTSAEDLVGGPWLHPQHWSSDGTQPWCSWGPMDIDRCYSNSTLAGVARGASTWFSSRHLVIIIENFFLHFQSSYAFP